MLCVLTLTSFFIPFGPEMQIGISIMLAFSVFKLRLSDDVPVQSDNIPLINIYFTMCMTFSLSAMVWFSIMNRCREKNRVPKFVRFIVLNYICYLTCEFKHAKLHRKQLESNKSSIKYRPDDKKNKKNKSKKSISFEGSNRETLLPKQSTNSPKSLNQNREPIINEISSSSPLNNTSTYDSSTSSITSNAKQSLTNNKASIRNCATFNSLDFNNLKNINESNYEVYRKIPITFQKNENLNKRRNSQINYLKAPIYLDNEDEFSDEIHVASYKQPSKKNFFKRIKNINA